MKERYFRVLISYEQLAEILKLMDGNHRLNLNTGVIPSIIDEFDAAYYPSLTDPHYPLPKDAEIVEITPLSEQFHTVALVFKSRYLGGVMNEGCPIPNIPFKFEEVPW